MMKLKEMKLTSFLQKMFFIILFVPVTVGAQDNNTQQEPHRPFIHFTPKKGWMNDPNGMVYYNGTYHLFFQHNPDKPVWGPMHWGHATSTNLVNWEEQPIALYPDALGTIFSGSAVIDVNNTAGFGKNAMVAIYTNHSHDIEKEGFETYQTQSIAYSLDEGKTWIKYKGNPVLPNPHIVDFRDPKVMWYEAQKKWVMTLATKDRITFYASPDLKNWNKESEFGEKLGAHGGVWECPDLFPLMYNGKQVWVLLVSINPGGPNGGSATQYFVGDFDGHTFTPYDTEQRWMDYGTDNYAGVTFFNTENRRVLIGWMSNWQYAQVVPTVKWRSAMTLPRELSIREINGELFLASSLIPEAQSLFSETNQQVNFKSKKPYNVASRLGKINGLFSLELKDVSLSDFSIVLSNAKGNELLIGYDKNANQYYIDRSRSGITGFETGFAKKHIAPRISNSQKINLHLVVDKASVELFADDGLTVMTDIFFPEQPITEITIKPGKNEIAGKINYTSFKP